MSSRNCSTITRTSKPQTLRERLQKLADYPSCLNPLTITIWYMAGKYPQYDSGYVQPGWEFEQCPMPR